MYHVRLIFLICRTIHSVETRLSEYTVKLLDSERNIVWEFITSIVYFVTENDRRLYLISLLQRCTTCYRLGIEFFGERGKVLVSSLDIVDEILEMVFEKIVHEKSVRKKVYKIYKV